jgi:hypothetical protein
MTPSRTERPTHPCWLLVAPLTLSDADTANGEAGMLATGREYSGSNLVLARKFVSPVQYHLLPKLMN